MSCSLSRLTILIRDFIPVQLHIEVLIKLDQNKLRLSTAQRSLETTLLAPCLSQATRQFVWAERPVLKHALG